MEVAQTIKYNGVFLRGPASLPTGSKVLVATNVGGVAAIDYSDVASLLGSTINITNINGISGSPITIGTTDSQAAYVKTNNINRWYWDQTGNFLSANDNVYAIGQANSNRPSMIYTVGLQVENQVRFKSQGYLTAASNGQYKFHNQADSAGVGFDVTTDGTLRLRNKEFNADAALTASEATFSANLTFSNQSQINFPGTTTFIGTPTWQQLDIRGGSGPGSIISVNTAGVGAISLSPHNGETRFLSTISGRYGRIGSTNHNLLLGASSGHWQANVADGIIQLASLCAIAWSNSVQADQGTSDVALTRNAAGQLDVRANNGLRIRNLANSADSLLQASGLTTAGHLTFSSGGNISFSSGSLVLPATMNASNGWNNANLVCTSQNGAGGMRLDATFNSAGLTPTAFAVNLTDTLSNANSLLLDLRTGGVSQFSVSKTGNVTLGQGLMAGSATFVSAGPALIVNPTDSLVGHAIDFRSSGTGSGASNGQLGVVAPNNGICNIWLRNATAVNTPSRRGVGFVLPNADNTTAGIIGISNQGWNAAPIYLGHSSVDTTINGNTVFLNGTIVSAQSAIRLSLGSAVAIGSTTAGNSGVDAFRFRNGYDEDIFTMQGVGTAWFKSNVTVAGTLSIGGNSTNTVNISSGTTHGIGIGSSGGAATGSGFGVAIGGSASAGTNCVAIGRNATTSGQSAMAFGYLAAAPANSVVFSGGDQGLSNVYFGRGNGVTNGTANTVAIQPTGMIGTNLAAGSLVLRGGISTGNATPGTVVVQTGAIGASGSAPQTPFDVATFNHTGMSVAGTLNSITSLTTPTSHLGLYLQSSGHASSTSDIDSGFASFGTRSRIRTELISGDTARWAVQTYNGTTLANALSISGTNRKSVFTGPVQIDLPDAGSGNHFEVRLYNNPSNVLFRIAGGECYGDFVSSNATAAIGNSGFMLNQTGVLQWQGSVNWYPAGTYETRLRRVSTGLMRFEADNGLQIKTANGSADAPISASSANFSGNITANTVATSAISFASGGIRVASAGSNLAGSISILGANNNGVLKADFNQTILGWGYNGGERVYFDYPVHVGGSSIPSGAMFQVTGNSIFTGTGVFNSHVTQGWQSSASDPTTSDIPSGSSRMWKNTTTGEIRTWANDGGIMKKSAALT